MTTSAVPLFKGISIPIVTGPSVKVQVGICGMGEFIQFYGPHTLEKNPEKYVKVRITYWNQESCGNKQSKVVTEEGVVRLDDLGQIRQALSNNKDLVRSDKKLDDQQKHKIVRQIEISTVPYRYSATKFERLPERVVKGCRQITPPIFRSYGYVPESPIRMTYGKGHADLVKGNSSNPPQISLQEWNNRMNDSFETVLRSPKYVKSIELVFPAKKEDPIEEQSIFVKALVLDREHYRRIARTIDPHYTAVSLGFDPPKVALLTSSQIKEMETIGQRFKIMKSDQPLLQLGDILPKSKSKNLEATFTVGRPRFYHHLYPW